MTETSSVREASHESREAAVEESAGVPDAAGECDDNYIEDFFNDLSNPLEHPDDAPNGSYQEVYWSDGVLILRRKERGVWIYSLTTE